MIRIHIPRRREAQRRVARSSSRPRGFFNSVFMRRSFMRRLGLSDKWRMLALSRTGEPQREGAQRQPRQDVWDILERQVKRYTPNPTRTFNEPAHERREVNHCHICTLPNSHDLRGGQLGAAVGGG
jgi:hypothetical protein